MLHSSWRYSTAPDFGFAFLPGAQGKGYGLEASKAILTQPTVKALPELLAITLERNARSIRLLESLGFQFEGKASDEQGTELLRYRLR